MATNDDYVCAVSGVATAPAEHSEGTLEDLPVGWTRVTLQIRSENPEYQQIKDATESLVEQQLSLIPEEEQREEARPIAKLMARATFATLMLSTPRYLTREEEVEVSAQQLPALLELLGLSDEDAGDDAEEE